MVSYSCGLFSTYSVNPFSTGDFGEKCYFQLVKPFSAYIHLLTTQNVVCKSGIHISLCLQCQIEILRSGHTFTESKKRCWPQDLHLCYLPSYLISSFDISSFLFSLFFTIHNIHYFCNTICFCKKARQGFWNHFKEHVNTSTPWEKFIITQIL